MKFTSALFVSLVIGRVHSSQEPIGTFSPITQVTDHAAIDLDQIEIESLLSENNFGAAQDVYTNGANSKSVADLTLTVALPTSLKAKMLVTGIDTTGMPVAGKIYKDAPAGATSLQVQYATSDSQANHVGCRVGGSLSPVTDGCFAATGSVKVNGVQYPYEYTVGNDNFNDRTIQGMSTAVNKHRKFGDGKNAFYDDMHDFQDYYGAADYADRLVTAALTGTDAGLTRGNMNYVGLADEARVEGVKKGTAYLNIFMYMIRELEDSLDDCELKCDRDECNDDAVHALDEAVAFYAGSTQGNGNNGKLLYALAEKRCNNYGTCDSALNVNDRIFIQFKRMQDNLLQQKCGAARTNKEKIVNLMYIPMIQGALRYSYFQDYQNDATPKSDAEGAAFAAAVLPKIHACSPSDAKIIYDNLKLGNSLPVEHKDVKRAFEKNYDCMRITCEDVGGLTDGEEYFDGAEPCGDGPSSVAIGVGVAGSVGGLLLLATCFVCLARKRKSARSVEKQNQIEMGNSPIA